MALNISVTIGDHCASFFDEQVEAGPYGSIIDVLRAGLRLLEEHETRVKSLQDALIVELCGGQFELQYVVEQIRSLHDEAVGLSPYFRLKRGDKVQRSNKRFRLRYGWPQDPHCASC